MIGNLLKYYVKAIFEKEMKFSGGIVEDLNGIHEDILGTQFRFITKLPQKCSQNNNPGPCP